MATKTKRKPAQPRNVTKKDISCASCASCGRMAGCDCRASADDPDVYACEDCGDVVWGEDRCTCEQAADEEAANLMLDKDDAAL